MDTRRHRHAGQRQTQPDIEGITPWHGTRFGAAQGPAPFLVPFPDPKQTPHFMSPPPGGDKLCGAKTDPKSGPQNGAINRSLPVEIAWGLYMHLLSRQRSHESNGSKSLPEAYG